MTPERIPSTDARELARALVADLQRTNPGLLLLGGVELSGALEQQLFFALRDGWRPSRDPASRVRLASARIGRLAAAAAAASISWRAPDPGPDPIVVLVRARIHVDTLLRIEGHLRALADEVLAMVRVGKAASMTVPHAVAPRLGTLLDPALVPGLIGHAGASAAGLGVATAGWPKLVHRDRAIELRAIAGEALGRIALGSAGLASVARRWQPALLVALDEVGTWARLLPAVAHRYGIPSLDLPHAEAADSTAIRGAGYDRMAVYGSTAAEIVSAAGIDPERISEIGAPRFDPLVGLTTSPAREPRRVVFAAQYLQRSMTRELLEHAYLGAVAAAEVNAPAELVVVPHPAEQPGLMRSIVDAHNARSGVAVRLAAGDSLHAELATATLLVTGWSNAVLEAAICGVPAVTVAPVGVAPVDFAADGLALSGADVAEVVAAARRLQDPAARAEVVGRARRAVIGRLGPLDGRASERAARIMLQMAGKTINETLR